MGGVEEFEFHCITDREPGGDEWMWLMRLGITPRKIQTARKGWWQKIQLFSPHQFFPEQRVLYLDLDVVIVGSLKNILKTDDAFVMIENFGPNRWQAAHNSSAMLWTVGEGERRIWDEFTDDVPEKLHGDQCWIWRCQTDARIKNWPKPFIKSYKYDVLHSKPVNLTETAIIVYHGEPKPHQLNDHWSKVWRQEYDSVVAKVPPSQ